MFAHVLALCFILRLLKRSNHYAPYYLSFGLGIVAEMKSRTQPSRTRTHKNIRSQGPTSRGQSLSRPKTGMLEAKNTRRKFSPKKQEKGLRTRRSRFSAKIRRSPKKRPSQIFREISADFQGKVKRRSWPWLIFNESKKVLSSSREQDIFKDLRL